MQQFDNDLTIMQTNSSEDNASIINGTTSPKIVLAMINAKFIHASLGLRYLYANLKELQECCEVQEFVIQTRPMDIVEKISESKPTIVGLGVYIWNIIETTNVISLL